VTHETLALLGGPPAFPDGLRLLRPTLPPVESVQAGLGVAFASGALTKGPALREYEERLAEHLGVRHALAVSSCTAGLMLVYQRLAERPNGGEAIMPSFTFMATAIAAAWAGLEPVFCDVDPETWCLHPERVEAAITDRTAVIVPVHVFGAPVDTIAFARLSEKTGVPVVYDAAHGFGAQVNGRPVGREGLASCFSTSPTKLLITGEGGVVATDDDALAERVVVGREYGNPGTFDPLFCGLNARLPEAGALMGLAGLGVLEREAARRGALADVYRNILAFIPGLEFQHVRPGTRSSFKDLTLRIRPEAGLSPDHVAEALRAEGIDTRRYYVPPVHRQTAFAHLRERFEPQLPETVALCDQVLTLPCYGGMSEEAAARVARCVRSALARAADVRAALGG